MAAAHAKAGERPAPQLELQRLYWRMQGPSGKTLTCGLYLTAAGLEVQSSYTDDELLRSQFTPDIGTAGEVAAEWKAGALAKGLWN